MSALKPAVCAALQQAGTPERAEKEKTYQKSSWTHWGCAFPIMDKVLRQTLKGVNEDELIALAYDLWREPVWDCKIAAGRVIALPKINDVPRVWGFVTDKVTEIDGWAIGDNLAPAARHCLLADTTLLDEVEGWIKHDSFWVRRAALIFTLPWAKPGMDPSRSLGWAAKLAPEREWFIQKAIGWWLRQLGKHDPDRVRTFLEIHEDNLMAVAKNEARKYLT